MTPPLVAPRAAVVVPTRNRPTLLDACLASLAALKPPPGGFEVIVVDDGGTADPSPVVARWSERLRLSLLRRDHAGPAAARNAGVAATSAAIVAFTDDDCRPHPDWLRNLLPALERQPRALAGGRTLNALEQNAFSAASQALVDHLYAHFLDGPRPGAFFTSNNLAAARSTFLETGGFDETFRQAAGEDRELGDRWRRCGLPLVHEPSAVVSHFHELGPISFWRQHFNYGRAGWRFQARRIEAGEPLRVEPLRFYLGLLGAPFRLGLASPISVSALLLVSQVANALGVLQAAVADRRPRRASPAPASRHTSGTTGTLKRE